MKDKQELIYFEAIHVEEAHKNALYKQSRDGSIVESSMLSVHCEIW